MNSIDDSGIRWSEAEEKDLVPGLYLYRSEDDCTWLALIGENKTFFGSMAFTTSIRIAKQWGIKTDEETTRSKFPILSSYSYKVK